MDRPKPVESMIVTGQLRVLPSDFEGLQGTEAMRVLLDTHIDNMGVLDELRLKHAALVDWINGSP